MICVFPPLNGNPACTTPAIGVCVLCDDHTCGEHVAFHHVVRLFDGTTVTRSLRGAHDAAAAAGTGRPRVARGAHNPTQGRVGSLEGASAPRR